MIIQKQVIVKELKFTSLVLKYSLITEYLTHIVILNVIIDT